MPLLQYFELAVGEDMLCGSHFDQSIEIGKRNQFDIGIVENTFGRRHLVVEDRYHALYGATIVAQDLDNLLNIISRIHLILNNYHFLTRTEVALDLIFQSVVFRSRMHIDIWQWH